MHFLSRCYSAQIEIWKDDSKLGFESNPTYGLARKINTPLNMATPKFVVLLIDSTLRVSVEAIIMLNIDKDELNKALHLLVNQRSTDR